MQVGQQSGKAGLVPERVDSVKLGFKYSNAFLVDGVFINARGVIVANFLLVGVAVRSLGRVFQNAAQHSAVALRQFSKTAPDGLISGDWIALLPAAASELVKVHARVSSFIQRGNK